MHAENRLYQMEDQIVGIENTLKTVYQKSRYIAMCRVFYRLKQLKTRFCRESFVVA